MRLPLSPAACVALWFELAMLAVEAQQVMALRMMRLGLGGAAADAEARRAVSEKATAAASAGLAAAVGLAAGSSGTAVARQAVRGYRRRVGANRRRLIKTTG